VSYQQYLENRREKRLAIRKNYIWDIHSDDETFQTCYLSLMMSRIKRDERATKEGTAGH
jgi:hypothetical protein